MKQQLIVLLGLPGTGKTTLLNRLRKRHEVSSVCTDDLWLRHFPCPAYTTEESNIVFEMFLSEVEERLSKHHHLVIAEGVFASEVRVLRMAACARVHDAEFHLVGCKCSEKASRERMKHREKDGDGSSVPPDLWKLLESRLCEWTGQYNDIIWLDTERLSPEQSAEVVSRELLHRD